MHFAEASALQGGLTGAVVAEQVLITAFRGGAEVEAHVGFFLHEFSRGRGGQAFFLCVEGLQRGDRTTEAAVLQRIVKTDTASGALSEDFCVSRERAFGEAGLHARQVDVVIPGGGGEHEVLEGEVLETKRSGRAARDLKRRVDAAGGGGAVDLADDLQGRRSGPFEG